MLDAYVMLMMEGEFALGVLRGILSVCGSEGVHTQGVARAHARPSRGEGSCHAGSRDTLEMKIVLYGRARAVERGPGMYKKNKHTE